MRAMRATLRLAGMVFAVVAAAAILPSTVAAQGPPPGPGGPPAQLTVSPTDVMFPAPTDIEYDAGWVDYGGVSITLEPRGNRNNWQLFVQASAADMGGYGKPVGDVLVRAEGSSSWTPLTTTAQMVAEGSGTATITVYYRLLLDWSLDEPGAYSVPIEYSAQSF